MMSTARRFALALVAAATLPGAAVAAKHAKDEWKTWQPQGAPVDCIQINTIRQSYVRDDSTIDFETNGRRFYRVTLHDPCPELGFEQSFAYETSLSQLCSTDIITVLHRGEPRIPGASCGLASFQPIVPTAPAG